MAVQIHQLLLDSRFEVEEDGPAAGVAEQVRGEAAVQALHGSVVGEEGPQDAEGTDGTRGDAAVDWEVVRTVVRTLRPGAGEGKTHSADGS